MCERPRCITFNKDMQVCAFDIDEEPAQVAVTPRSRENVCLLSPQSGLEAHRQKLRMQKAFDEDDQQQRGGGGAGIVCYAPSAVWMEMYLSYSSCRVPAALFSYAFF